MEDVQEPPVGTKGTVTGVDDIGSIMVAWDNGSGLNVVYGEDSCRKISADSKPCSWKEGSIGIPKKDGGKKIIHYRVKAMAEADNTGINNGKISKLTLRMNGEFIAKYDGTWEIEPACQEAALALCILLNNYN